MGRVIPTLADYAETVRSAASDSGIRAWGPYWDRMVNGFGDGRLALGPRPLDEITATMIRAGSREAARTGIRRRGTRDGRSSEEHYISAARHLLAAAVADRLVTENVALLVAKPRRLPSRRHALNSSQLAEIWVAAAQGGHDPGLDILLLRFHLETGARREGALNLRPCDISRERQTVLLREKGGTEREQPVSARLMRALLAHASDRAPGADRGSSLLRYRDGTPLTRRRYNSLWDRIGKELPWVSHLGVSMHWLRHTAITNVERASTYAIAQRFAGHTPTEVTGTYAKATINEVAAAVQRLTGEPHPLAR